MSPLVPNFHPGNCCNVWYVLQTQCQQSPSHKTNNSSRTFETWNRAPFLKAFVLTLFPSNSFFFFCVRAGLGRRTLAVQGFSGVTDPCQEMSSLNHCFPQRRCDKVSARGSSEHLTNRWEREKKKKAGWGGVLTNEGASFIDWDGRLEKKLNSEPW